MVGLQQCNPQTYLPHHAHVLTQHVAARASFRRREPSRLKMPKHPPTHTQEIHLTLRLFYCCMQPLQAYATCKTHIDRYV